VYESVSRSDNAPHRDAVRNALHQDTHARQDGAELTGLTQLTRRVVALLGAGRAGLVTDVDGTISPIVARPEEARVLPRAREALLGLRDLLSLVAVVSGRSVADARNMVGVDGLVYVGNHGLEVWGRNGPETVPEARPWVPRLAAVLGEVTVRLKDSRVEIASEGAERGVLIENKGATASLHYRLAPDREQARRTLLEILARAAVTSGLRIEEGRMVINLLPPLMVTKGSAVSWLVREHRIDRLVYLGDDITDAHAFKALAVLRQTEGIHTLGIGVVGPETPPSVRQLADAAVPSVEAVGDLLHGVLEGLKSARGSSATMDSRAPGVGRIQSDGQRRAHN
jgi:trehalose 6-phosphate phosphatase